MEGTSEGKLGAKRLIFRDVGPVIGGPGYRTGVPMVTMALRRPSLIFNVPAIVRYRLVDFQYATMGHDPANSALLFRFHNNPEGVGAVRLGGSGRKSVPRKNSVQRGVYRTGWTEHEDLQWLRDFHAKMVKTQSFVLSQYEKDTYYIRLILDTNIPKKKEGPELFQIPPSVQDRLDNETFEKFLAALSDKEKLKILNAKGS